MLSTSSSHAPSSLIPLRHQTHLLHHHSHNGHHHHHYQHQQHGYALSNVEEQFEEELEGGEENRTTESMRITLDEAIEMNQTLGFFHYRMFLLCGLAFMADALEVNLLAFLATCAGVEWSLSNAQKASITGIVFCGIIVGSAIWGVVSDLYGRKTGFILATLVVSIGGFFSSIAPSYGILLFCQSLVGLGIGGTSVPFDLLAELMPINKRGVFLIYIQYFWAVGSMAVSGLAWLLLDSYGWRTLALITVIPVALTSIVSILYLPESPRWLLSIGKCAQAEKILLDAAHLNGLRLPDFQLRPDDSSTSNNSHSSSSTINYLSIIKNRHIRNVMIPLWIVWGSFGFTYYGIILFVSRLYTTSSEDSLTCSFDYSSIFLNAMSEVFSVTLSAILVESIGRIKIQTVFYALGAIAVFFMGFRLPTLAMILIGMIGRIAVFTSSVRIFTTNHFEYFLL